MSREPKHTHVTCEVLNVGICAHIRSITFLLACGCVGVWVFVCVRLVLHLFVGCSCLFKLVPKCLMYVCM